MRVLVIPKKDFCIKSIDLAKLMEFPPFLLSVTSTNPVSSDNFCTRPWYGRDKGVPIHSCPDSDNNGGLCYTRCAENYHGVGPVCWETCADGYHDDGAFCRRPQPLKIYAKKSYGRGSGKPLQCPKDAEYDAGLCYAPCNKDYNGIGSYCWKKCPESYPVACDIGCAKSKAACDAVYGIVLKFGSICP